MAAPRLVMLSGWGYPPPAWTSTLRRLAPVCETIVIDAPDLLDVSSGTLREEAPDRIRAHCDASRITILGGWSLGGMLALQCAPRLESDVAALLLIGTTTRFCADETQGFGVPVAQLRAMRRRLRRDPADVLKRFYRDCAMPSGPGEVSDAAAWLPDLAAGVERLAAGLACLERTDLRDGISAVALPATVLHGDRDGIVPCDAGHALAGRLRHGRLVVVPHTGHDLPLRRADAVRRAVQGLLDSACARR